MGLRRRQGDEGRAGEEEASFSEADLNEVVAYNFKRARELRGWTQDEVADRLAPYLGVRLPQASISGIERGYRGRPREFDAQELFAFSLCFDVPLIWFLLPPAGDQRRMRNSGEYLQELYGLVLGREDQLELLYERFRELGRAEPGVIDRVFEQMSGRPSAVTMADYRRRRKELLLAFVDAYSDHLDEAATELGAIFDKLRQLGLRAFVSEQMNDPDYGLPPEARGRVKLFSDEEVDQLRRDRLDEVRAGSESEHQCKVEQPKRPPKRKPVS